MLFSPRRAPTCVERLRVAIWPRRSFGRSVRYLGWRVVRLGGNPHGLALGLAAGVFVATLPLLGAQMVLAAALAWAIRGNVPAALLGTFWANPVTTPVLWLGAYLLGSLVMTGDASVSPAELADRIWQAGEAIFAPSPAPLAAAYAKLRPILLPLALGSVALGAASAAAFYFLCYQLICAHRRATTNARAARRAMPPPTRLPVPLQPEVPWPRAA